MNLVLTLFPISIIGMNDSDRNVVRSTLKKETKVENLELEKTIAR
ncbi:hypothetical protein BN1843_28160 [Escherichia coli]|nr:hypothetical protein BN1843_28160 [Escherichia coli]